MARVPKGGSYRLEVKAVADSTIGIIYPTAVQHWLTAGKSGAKTGAHFLHWIASQLAHDARVLNDQLRDALK